MQKKMSIFKQVYIMKNLRMCFSILKENRQKNKQKRVVINKIINKVNKKMIIMEANKVIK